MANASLTGAVADWENNNHTWREEDAEFLQDRAVIRVADATEAAALSSPYTIDEGSTVHLADENTLASYDGSVWRRAFMGRYAEVGADSVTAIQLRHSSATNGISLKADGNVDMGGSLAVTGAVTASTSVTTPTLNMSTASITSAGDSITVAAGGGGNFTVNKAAVFGSTVNVTGTTTLGTANITTATVSGVLTSNGSISGNTASFAGSVSAPSFVAGTNVTASGTGLFRSNTDYGVIIGANGPTLKGNGSGEVKLQQVGRTETAGVAGWVESATPPNLEDYPDGTIWFEV